MLFSFLNIWKIIYLNCWESYEDIIDHSIQIQESSCEEHCNGIAEVMGSNPLQAWIVSHFTATSGNSIEIELILDFLSNFTCWSRKRKFWNKNGGPSIRLTAGGHLTNPIIPYLLSCVLICLVVFWSAKLGFGLLSSVLISLVVFWSSCHVVLSCAMLCYVALCCAMLCYNVL